MGYFRQSSHFPVYDLFGINIAWLIWHGRLSSAIDCGCVIKSVCAPQLELDVFKGDIEMP